MSRAAYRWTAEEEQALRELAATASVRDIASALNRSLSSIYTRAHKLGISISAAQRDAKTYRRNGLRAQMIRVLVDAGYTPVEIGSALADGVSEATAYDVAFGRTWKAGRE